MMNGGGRRCELHDLVNHPEERGNLYTVLTSMDGDLENESEDRLHTVSRPQARPWGNPPRPLAREC